MDLKEYFQWKGMAASGFEVDGHFRGYGYLLCDCIQSQSAMPCQCLSSKM